MSEDRTASLSPAGKARLLRRLRSRGARPPTESNRAPLLPRSASPTPPVAPAPAVARRTDALSRQAPPSVPPRREPRRREDDVTALIDPNFRRDRDVIRAAGDLLAMGDPQFRLHDGVAGAVTVIGGQQYLNFGSYDYLGLSGDRRVTAAAKEAIDRYGTSASASRLAAGERAPHRALERALAEFQGTEDALIFPGFNAANAAVIGHLFSAKDLILHDAASRDSAVEGAILSGARRMSFPHNDAAAVDRILKDRRGDHRHAMIMIESHDTMEGDLPDLPAFIAAARRHRAFLLVNEAHGLGVVGPRGAGLAEHFGVDPGEVDLRIGSLGYALAGGGGYVATRRAVIEYLKFTAPSFVRSVAVPPSLAAASLAALDVLRGEPDRVRRLNANAKRFRDALRAKGLDTGRSAGLAIVPVITGSSLAAGRLADLLYRRFINVQPVIYPAVPERLARLCFVLSSEHTVAQIDAAVTAIVEAGAGVATKKLDLAALLQRLGVAAKPQI
jgi:8-amino-7-oxononanoate synthase